MSEETTQLLPTSAARDIACSTKALPSDDDPVTPAKASPAPVRLMSAEEKAARRKKLLELLDEEKKYVEKAHKLYPCITFKPHVGQRRILKAIDDGLQKGFRSIGLFMPNRWGKSDLMVNIAINIIKGAQNEHMQPYKMFSEWKWPKKIRIVCHADEVKDIKGAIWLAIQRWWPKMEYTAARHGMTHDSIYEFNVGGNPQPWTLDIVTFGQDDYSMESVELGCIIYSEPPPKWMWSAGVARLSAGGFRMLVGTLVIEAESEWIFEDIINNPECLSLWGELHENCKQCNDGYLEHEELERMVKEWMRDDPEKGISRSTGKPIHLRGRVLAIEPAVHFRPRSELPERLTNYLGLDPHQCRPYVGLVAGYDAMGDIWVHFEYPNLTSHPGQAYQRIQRDDLGIEQYANLIHGWRSDFRVRSSVIDEAFANQTIRKDYGNTTLLKELERHGLSFYRGVRQVEGESGSLAKLKQLIAYDRTIPASFIPPYNKPRLFIIDDLFNTKASLQNLSRKKGPDGRLLDTLDDKYLDYARVLMYIIMLNMGYDADHVAQMDAKPKASTRAYDPAYERKVIEGLGIEYESLELANV